MTKIQKSSEFWLPPSSGDLEQTWTEFRSMMPVASSIAYFDHAAVGPMFGPGGTAIGRFVEQATSQGDLHWPDWNHTVGSVRSAAAELLDCPGDHIATIANTTTGINVIADGFSLREGDNVVVPDHEFPSNLFPWQNQQSRGVEVRVVPRRGAEVRIDDLIDACDHRTRLISASWVGYATGFRIDVEQLVDRAHRSGVLVFLDAIQGLGIFPLSIRDIPVDFLAADGHKWLLGPEGFGVMMVRPDHLDKIRCTNVGWASVKESFNYSSPSLNLRGGATRFENGSANMMAAAALNQSLGYINAIGRHHRRGAIADRVLDNADLLEQELRHAGAVVDRSPDRKHQSGIVSFNVPGIEPATVRSIGIANDVVLSCRGNAIRAAIHAYNNPDDIERLCGVVVAASRRADSPQPASPSST